MIDIRPVASLGHADHGWLQARHHFSFAGYHDPQRMGWGALRVWNDDAIAPGAGFPPHPHADMEIITYVHEGAISHQDSLGNRGKTVAGDVQVMSAGQGITHSEANLEAEATRLFQIWILPDTRGGAPTWGTRAFPKGERAGRFVVLASGLAEDAGSEALPLRAQARVAAATLAAGEQAHHRLGTGRRGYLVLVRGQARVNGVEVAARDGVAIRDEDQVVVEAGEKTEVVLVDVLA